MFAGQAQDTQHYDVRYLRTALDFPTASNADRLLVFLDYYIISHYQPVNARKPHRFVNL